MEAACRNDPWQPTEEKVISYISEFTYEESIFFSFDVKYKAPKEMTYFKEFYGVVKNSEKCTNLFPISHIQIISYLDMYCDHTM